MESESAVQGYLKKVSADYPHAPEQIELRRNDKNEITFGRGVGNTVVWESLQISRRHSVMEYRPETHQWRLKDTSTNGMMVNQQKIPKNSFVDLNDQDLISFVPTGALSYRFVAVPNTNQAQSLSNSNRRAAVVLDAQIINNNVPQNLTTGRRASDDDPEIYECQFLPAKSPKRKPNEDEGMGKLFQLSPPLVKRKKAPVFSDMDMDNDDIVPLMPPVKRENQVPVISARNKGDLFQRSENVPLKSSTADADDGMKKQLALYRDKIKQLESDQYANDQKMKAENQELRNQLQMVQSENRISQEVVYKRVLDVLETEYSCCVCNEVFIQATVVDCGHTFCGHCIAEWVKRKTECPNCRKPVKMQSKHTEMENFITKFFEMLPEDMLVKRNEIIAERKKEQEDAARAAAAATIAQRNMMAGAPGARGSSVYANFIAGGDRGGTEYYNTIHHIVNPDRIDRLGYMVPGPPEMHRRFPHFMPEMPHIPPPPPPVFGGADMRRGAPNPYNMQIEIPRTTRSRRRPRTAVTFAPMAHQQPPHQPPGLDFVTVD